MRDATRVVRAGLSDRPQGAPFLPGPTFAGPFHLAGEPSSAPFVYGRYDNPTWQLYERALEELEGGPCIVFGSGMAACVAVLGVTLRPGDVVVLPADAYFTVRVISEGWFREMGVQVRTAPTAGDAQRNELNGARLLWLESPSNPGLDVCDIAALCVAAKQRGALVAVDNTTATMLGQQPLALGADFSISSDTKAITGHGDLLLGHVATRDAEWADRLRTWRRQMGSIAGPFEVWLAHRSLSSLDVRLERMCANAQAVAEFLATHDAVKRVRYPGLVDDPANAIAKGQMSRFGPVVSFELEDHATADRFLNACEIVLQATSFGGVHSTAERRARWGSDAVPEGFIRLSAGIEHPEDLIADIGRALSVATEA